MSGSSGSVPLATLVAVCKPVVVAVVVVRIGHQGQFVAVVHTITVGVGIGRVSGVAADRVDLVSVVTPVAVGVPRVRVRACLVRIDKVPIVRLDAILQRVVIAIVIGRNRAALELLQVRGPVVIVVGTAEPAEQVEVPRRIRLLPHVGQVVVVGIIGISWNKRRPVRLQRVGRDLGADPHPIRRQIVAVGAVALPLRRVGQIDVIARQQVCVDGALEPDRVAARDRVLVELHTVDMYGPGDAIVELVVLAQVPGDRDRRHVRQLGRRPTADRPVLATVARAVRVGVLLREERPRGSRRRIQVPGVARPLLGRPIPSPASRVSGKLDEIVRRMVVVTAPVIGEIAVAVSPALSPLDTRIDRPVSHRIGDDLRIRAGGK